MERHYCMKGLSEVIEAALKHVPDTQDLIMASASSIYSKIKTGHCNTYSRP